MWLIALVSALCVFGLIMVYSSSFLYAEERTGDGLYFIRRQLTYAGIGALFAFVVSKIPIRFYRDKALHILGGTILLLILVKIPGLGIRVGGAQRWLGFGSLRFQPSELAKVACVIFAARQLARLAQTSGGGQGGTHGAKFDFRNTFWVPSALIIPVLALLMLQPDFGSTVLIVLTQILLLFLSGAPLGWLMGGMGLLGSGAVLAIVTSEYRRARFAAFMDPWLDPSGKGFQVIQSMLGLNNGSFFGAGLGNGKEKLFFLPEAHNDFIFAVIGEELGFLGVASVILAFSFLLYRGLKISWASQEKGHNAFSFLLGAGITSHLALQAFVNMAVVMGLLPTKGLTLPFISYGGSALIFNICEAAILYRISAENNSKGYSHA